MIYTYHKRPKPVIDQNIKILLQNPKTFGGGHLNVGAELGYEYFFEVKDLNSNLLGFLWFEFNIYSTGSIFKIYILSRG